MDESFTQGQVADALAVATRCLQLLGRASQGGAMVGASCARLPHAVA